MTEFVKKLVTNEAAAAAALSPGGASEAPPAFEHTGRQKQTAALRDSNDNNHNRTNTQTHRHKHPESPLMQQVIEIK